MTKEAQTALNKRQDMIPLLYALQRNALPTITLIYYDFLTLHALIDINKNETPDRLAQVSSLSSTTGARMV
jgi:hypothetical protein